MERWKGKTAVVTGGASGIGAAVTQALLAKGINVVSFDIQIERLKETAVEASKKKDFGKLHPVQCDLSKHDDIKKGFRFIEETLGGVDIIVNNAGVANYTRIIESDRQTFEKLLNINVLAVATCINESVRSMRARKVEGHIFNINSLAGHIIPPEISKEEGINGWNLYPTCKHATVAMTKSIRNEIKAVNAPIKVTSISPGLVKTEICQNIEGLEDFFEKSPYILPEDIADALMYALSTRPDVQVKIIIIRLFQATKLYKLPYYYA